MVNLLYRRLNIRSPMECRQKEISDCLRNGSVLVGNEKDKQRNVGQRTVSTNDS